MVRRIRSKKKRRIIPKIFFTLVILLLLTYIVSNGLIIRSKVSIRDEKIPKSFNGLKIVQISDLHSKEFGKNNNRLVNAVTRQSPDLVVFTGDMINTLDEDYSVFYRLATELSEKFKILFIPGNHELNLPEERYNEINHYLEHLGINVLDNEKIELTVNNQKINVYGLWFNLRFYRDLNDEESKEYFFGAEQIQSILGKADKDVFNLLLTHNPVYFETYSYWGADLTVTGHMHGGMIRVPFKGGLFSPEKVYFPEYDAGIFDLGGNTLIVNRGLGNGDLGFRMFNPPEITVITLYSN